ncbi:MAG: GNAT family N-acetyltransferase [Spirochaetales bacterium]|nr:GNAT family N-acetyltransferase [Spirochaetales bacterium]
MSFWSKGQAGDREGLLKLLLREEWSQLHFSSALREKKGFRLVEDGTVYLLKNREGKNIKGALHIARGGALHCCFEPAELKKDELDELGQILRERSFFSFIGRTDRIKLIEELYGACDVDDVDYDLLAKAKPLPSLTPPSLRGYEIRPVGKDNLKELFPLEEAYQKEEVVRDPSTLNLFYLKRRFMQQLGQNHIWAVYKEGRPVAKGGTNAEGFRYCQIGGVYTIPEERGRGIGRYLMNRISEDLYRQGWGTSLFVRKKNPAALALYKHCGYQKKGDFRIVYPQTERVSQ